MNGPLQLPDWVVALGERFVHWFSAHGAVLWPAIAGFGACVLLLGIIQAFGSKELRGLEASEIRQVVLQALKKKKHGASGDELARTTGIEPLQLVRALEELQKTGRVTSFTTTERLTVWRMRQKGE